MTGLTFTLSPKRPPCLLRAGKPVSGSDPDIEGGARTPQRASRAQVRVRITANVNQVTWICPARRARLRRGPGARRMALWASEAHSLAPWTCIHAPSTFSPYRAILGQSFAVESQKGWVSGFGPAAADPCTSEPPRSHRIAGQSVRMRSDPATRVGGCISECECLFTPLEQARSRCEFR